MGNGVQNILQKFSIEDIEKLKILLSIVPETTQKEVVTLRVFVEEYSNLIKQNRSNAYYKSVENAFKHFTDFFGNQRAIQSIGLKDIESFVSHLQKKVSKGYRVYVKTLKAAFSKAVDWGYVKENYFFKVKLPKRQQVNPVYISSKQLVVICEKIENDIIKDVVTFAFYTGMRLNEIVNLTWRNVDLSKKIITVGDEEFTTKGRNQRYIPICEEVHEALLRCETRNERSERKEEKRETRNERSEKKRTKNNTPRILQMHNPLCVSPFGKWGERHKYVFCKLNGEKFTGDYVSKTFKQACKDAVVDKSIHFHSLRHSFASNLAQSGVSLYTIKELLGHSSIATTEIYSHLNMDSLKDAIRVFDGPQQVQIRSLPEINSGQALNPLSRQVGIFDLSGRGALKNGG